MSEKTDLDRFWETLARVLLYCFVFCFFTQLFWALMIMLAGDWVYGIHSSFFAVSRPHFDLIHYAGIACLKTVSFVFFLFPFLAIKLAMRKRAVQKAESRPS